MYIQNLPKSQGKTQFPIRPDRPDFSFNTHLSISTGTYIYKNFNNQTPCSLPPKKTDFSLSFYVTYTCRRLGTCSRLLYQATYL